MLPPSVVLPIHDPDGFIFHHLERITPYLKQNFSTAFLSVTAVTYKKYPSQIDRIARDDLYQLLITPIDAQIGKQFKLLYQQVVSLSQPDQILHLCYPDRLAFALQDQYRDQFLEDIKAIQPGHTPFIFERSPKAWDSHPRNYYEIESIIATVSKRLLGRTIDFAWCHLAIQSFQLSDILPKIHRQDLSMVAEMLLPMIDKINSKDVDWLAWEDPLILSRNPETLKFERENSIVETKKRLGYVIPMVQMISEAAIDN